MELATIFVSIPSYRDPECQWTVKSLLETADEPERVSVGVCWQYHPDEDAQTCFSVKPARRFASQVRQVMMPWHRARGPCFARAKAQSLYQGEAFYLQVDSHMRFVRGWDSKLLAMWQQCTDFSPKPILTTYPSGYTPPNDLPAEEEQLPNMLYAKCFSNKDGMLRIAARPVKERPERPLPSRFMAAGFLFCEGSVVEEVPYDPHLKGLFFGEESVMAARLWTHGWDFFMPSEPVAFHLWSRDYRPTFREVQQPFPDVKASKLRIAHLLQLDRAVPSGGGGNSTVHEIKRDDGGGGGVVGVDEDEVDTVPGIADGGANAEAEAEESPVETVRCEHAEECDDGDEAEDASADTGDDEAQVGRRADLRRPAGKKRKGKGKGAATATASRKARERRIRRSALSSTPKCTETSAKGAMAPFRRASGSSWDPLQEIDVYGMGGTRTLLEYEEFAGVNFAAKTISEEARLGGLQPGQFLQDDSRGPEALAVLRAVLSQQGGSTCTTSDFGLALDDLLKQF